MCLINFFIYFYLGNGNLAINCPVHHNSSDLPTSQAGSSLLSNHPWSTQQAEIVPGVKRLIVKVEPGVEGSRRVYECSQAGTPAVTLSGITRSIQDSETSIDFVQGPPGSRRERVKDS